MIALHTVVWGEFIIVSVGSRVENSFEQFYSSKLGLGSGFRDRQKHF